MYVITRLDVENNSTEIMNVHQEKKDAIDWLNTYLLENSKSNNVNEITPISVMQYKRVYGFLYNMKVLNAVFQIHEYGEDDDTMSATSEETTMQE